MTKEELFESWAPSTSIWSPWAKPVLFSQMGIISELAPATDQSPPAAEPATVNEPAPPIAWATDRSSTTAIVADLPGAAGVAMGLALSAIGYRPVPLFNSCPEPHGDIALVNVHPIMTAIAAGAATLASISLPAQAPPIFLLDADRNRPTTPPRPGMFDNRSISLPTDFPSAQLLQSHRILRVVLLQADGIKPRADLSHTLRGWQTAGLEILAKTIDHADAPVPVTIKRPNILALLWYHLFGQVGYKRNPLGGYGGTLPMHSSG